MGLTIYYRLKARTDADGARSLVRRLHAFATTLPFDDVSEVREYDPPDGRYVFARAGRGAESLRWKPGQVYLTRKRGDGQTENVYVPALHVVCFHANCKGAETAVFGLASHPPVVVHREDIISSSPGGGVTHQLGAGASIEFPTRLRGWYSWSGFTKTQYAANPRYGGVANFIRAHLSIFKVVDGAKKLGLKAVIHDDAHYWKHRSEARLLAELAKWDELIAGFVGRFSDRIGDATGRIVASDQGSAGLRASGGQRRGPASESQAQAGAWATASPGRRR